MCRTSICFRRPSLRKLNPELEEQARVMGAPPWRVALTVSLPLAWPALVYSGVLIFFLGFELFGLPLIIGDAANVLVLTTYLFKLTNILGTPSYQLMAVVVVAIALVTLPLVYLQRHLLRDRRALRHDRRQGHPVRGRCGSAAGAGWRSPCIVLWLIVTVGLPLAGVLLRAFVSRWGEGINPFASLTLQNFIDLAEYPNLRRRHRQHLPAGDRGAAASVAVYAVVALAAHRWKSPFVAVIDYLVLLPRSMPGLVAGLAFLWVFLFVPYLGILRSSLVGLWLAYSVVWLAFGLRIISATLVQISPELEEAARVSRRAAGPGAPRRDAAAHPVRPDQLVAALLHDFRARILDRRLSAGARHRGAGTVDRDAVRRRLARAGGGAVGGECRARRRRIGAGAAARSAHVGWVS